jgi:hypothetical protein
VGFTFAHFHIHFESLKTKNIPKKKSVVSSKYRGQSHIHTVYTALLLLRREERSAPSLVPNFGIAQFPVFHENSGNLRSTRGSNRNIAFLGCPTFLKPKRPKPEGTTSQAWNSAGFLDLPLFEFYSFIKTSVVATKLGSATGLAFVLFRFYPHWKFELKDRSKRYAHKESNFIPEKSSDLHTEILLVTPIYRATGTVFGPRARCGDGQIADDAWLSLGHGRIPYMHNRQHRCVDLSISAACLDTFSFLIENSRIIISVRFEIQNIR